MNGLEPDKSSQIELLAEQRDRGPTAITAAILESQLEQEKAQRKIERFFWILPLTVLGSGMLVKLVNSFLFTAFIIVIAIVSLIGFARWLEVPWILIYLERAFARFSQSSGRPPPEGEEN
jgi:hypothetical protein